MTARITARTRAQRWHDTDHGLARGKKLVANRFRRPVPDDGRPPVSGCWCCCRICDADANPDGRYSPFWRDAVTEADAVRDDVMALVLGHDLDTWQTCGGVLGGCPDCCAIDRHFRRPPTPSCTNCAGLHDTAEQRSERKS